MASRFFCEIRPSCTSQSRKAATTGSLSGNGSIAINIRSLGTCAATVSSGSVDVAFHGPPAAIIGNITTIDGVAGVSFDAPFTARMPWSTATR